MQDGLKRGLKQVFSPFYSDGDGRW